VLPSNETILVEPVAEIILAGRVDGSEIVEDGTLDKDSMSCPSEIGEQLVGGFTPIQHPDGVAAFAFAVACTGLRVMVQTDLTTGSTAVFDVTNEVHADHLRASAHHPPTP
jgi:hypothetical protein